MLVEFELTTKEAYALYDHLCTTALTMKPLAWDAGLAFREALREAMGDEYQSHHERHGY